MIDGVYQRIFAGAPNTAELRSAIATAVRELRRAMEKDDNPVTMVHMRNLDDIDGGSLAQAYQMAEKNCIYWPTPGQIREFAGCSDTDKSAEALQWVLEYIEKHGVEGRQRGGAAVFGTDRAGRGVRSWL